jgi:23S rRNA (uracil1939-C5)-methyltransferase
VSERVVRLAARGDGVTDAGRFLPFAAPGDEVAGDGSLLPGPHRQVPPCRHFPECGGCQLQHVDDAAYAQFLVDRIVSALAAQRLEPAAMLVAHLSPPCSRRRATLRCERRGNELRIGFNEEKSHRIVDMRECHILRPELFALVAPLRRLLRALGDWKGRGAVTLTLVDQGVDMLLEQVPADGLAAAEMLGAFAAEWKLARLAIDDGFGPQTRWEPEPATVTLGGVAVPVPHGAFLQATQDGEQALVAAALETLEGARLVADLFAGLGTFALALPGRVYAAEGARDAALALKAAADRSGRQVFVDHRDLFRRPLEVDELARFEAVLLDPPRAGAREQVARLAASPVPRILYVSCNPSTFARDARSLVDGGYRLGAVRPVGQFRWSTHVELVSSFSR